MHIRIENDALTDNESRSFVSEMLDLLKGRATKSHEKAFGVLDMYSESMAYLIQRSNNDRLEIRKLRLAKGLSGPDFECKLTLDEAGKLVTLYFFLEMKTLDIADAPQRQPEIAHQMLDAIIELEKQITVGKRIVIAESEIAPTRLQLKISMILDRCVN